MREKCYMSKESKMAAYDECLLDAAKTGDLRFRVCDAGTAYGNFEESCS